VPTTGEAFTMTVAGKRSRAQGGRPRADEGDPDLRAAPAGGRGIIGSIGGFDLEYDGERLRQGRLPLYAPCCAHGAEHEVELAITVTPLGAIARLEHSLDDFEGDKIEAALSADVETSAEPLQDAA
jgi:hypothetical protein